MLAAVTQGQAGEMSLRDVLTREVHACDVCGGTSFGLVADFAPGQNRTLMCRGCGLFFASPAIALEHLDEFYDDEFDGDPGSVLRQESGAADTSASRRERRRAGRWAMPIIRRHLDPAGSSFLDIRSRSGELAKVLVEAGAQVTAIDPMAANVRQMSGVPGLEAITVQPSALDSLAVLGDRQFDAVSVLTIHTLSHLSSPSRFLRRLHELLKPGGYLFLDEKDVLIPARHMERSVFASGEAHFFHFTEESLARCIEEAGFELVECRHDPVRRSAFRHMIVVARRPAAASIQRTAQADVPAITRRLAGATRQLLWRAPYNRLVRTLKTLQGKKRRLTPQASAAR